jgi:hypothetical protein
VRNALGTLQFVEKDKIETDIKTKHVTFNVDKSKWDLDKVKAAIADKGFKDVKLISGPGA